MRQNFNAGHGCIALHGNKAHKQFPLCIRPQVRGLANDHVGLTRLPDRVEVLEKRISVAEDIENVGSSALFSPEGGRGLVPVAVAHDEMQQ